MLSSGFNKLMPCKRKDFIKKLVKLGFSNPEAGARHQIMRYESYKQVIPNNPEYSIPQVKRLLKQVKEKIRDEVGNKAWDKVKNKVWKETRRSLSGHFNPS